MAVYSDICFNPGQDLLAIACERKVNLVKFENGRWNQTNTSLAHNAMVTRVVWSPPCFGLLCTISADRSIRVWGEQWKQLARFVDHREQLIDASFLPPSHGLRLAVLALNGHLRVYECPEPSQTSNWTAIDDHDCTAPPVTSKNRASSSKASATVSTVSSPFLSHYGVASSLSFSPVSEDAAICAISLGGVLRLLQYSAAPSITGNWTVLGELFDLFPLDVTSTVVSNPFDSLVEQLAQTIHLNNESCPRFDFDSNMKSICTFAADMSAPIAHQYTILDARISPSVGRSHTIYGALLSHSVNRSFEMIATACSDGFVRVFSFRANPFEPLRMWRLFTQSSPRCLTWSWLGTQIIVSCDNGVVAFDFAFDSWTETQLQTAPMSA